MSYLFGAHPGPSQVRVSPRGCSSTQQHLEGFALCSSVSCTALGADSAFLLFLGYHCPELIPSRGLM